MDSLCPLIAESLIRRELALLIESVNSIDRSLLDINTQQLKKEGEKIRRRMEEPTIAALIAATTIFILYWMLPYFTTTEVEHMRHHELGIPH